MKVLRLFCLGASALLVAVPAALSPAAGSAHAPDTIQLESGSSCEAVAFDTSQSRFRSGLDNQGTVFGNAIEPTSGYWEDGGADAYAVGFEWEAPYELRNHFTFDLASLAPGSATGAVLVLRNGNDWSYGPGGLFRIREVTTAPSALNLHTAPPGPVFSDLGTGPVYGAKRIVKSTARGSVVRIRLNERGLAAVNSAAGGYFSVGGRLTNPNAEFFSILWRETSSSYGVQRLVVTTDQCG